MRETITVQGAKEHNLKNITVEIPRNQLVVITGVSGSGKSTLAFDTVYAEGQRRYLESMSTFAKKFIEQLKKPKVDFVMGLSPVISIEQKTTIRNPRSTVGTMTDIYDYIRMLFATIGVAHCPYCGREAPVKTVRGMLDHLMSLPEGTEVEIRAPVFKFYGEDWAYLFDDVRSKGYRRVYIDGRLVDTSQVMELDEDESYRVDVLVDHFIIRPGVDKQIQASLEHGLLIGEGFISLHEKAPTPAPPPSGELQADRGGDDSPGSAIGELQRERGGDDSPSQSTVSGSGRGLLAKRESLGVRAGQPLGCPDHGVLMGEQEAHYFSFNLPSGSSSCVTCLGLGTYRRVHPNLLVIDPEKGIRNGAFSKEALNYDKNNWTGRLIYSLAQHYGFSLDEPFRDLPPAVVEILFYGSKGEKFPILLPEGATVGGQHVGREMRFGGIINHIERSYRNYRKEGTYNHWMEEWLKKVMVEQTCPDCGGKRLKPQRFLVTVGGKTIHELGEMAYEELIGFLEAVRIPEKKLAAGSQVAHEIVRRLRLLLDIGLDYLTLNRPSSTLSGGESQRIRLSTQIGSDLMGMLYVLDEPTIGLHPYDSRKMVETLRRLRDLGNSVIVVEHDASIIRAADHIIELGPGPGEHGGEVVAAGNPDEIQRDARSLTGQFLSGARDIPLPARRRSPNGKNLVILGARENNLRNIDVTFPLGVFICVTGVSGSGKSSLVHEILYKKLYAMFYDHRVLPGKHGGMQGVEWISDVIHIDQSPIGRSPRSNPATYIGVYDRIRAIFAETAGARQRGFTASRFSFNVKGGRCEECQGEGVLRTHLQFMADVETVCPICKGAQFNAETLEVAYQGKNIAETLGMSIEEAAGFFAGASGARAVYHKLRTLRDLGMGYLKLGHPATKLSGGEAQRIKLAHELGKIKHGRHNLYILDEPTTGLHAADIEKLLDSLNRLVDAGHTVLVIEHHLDVIKTADWVIDLGPEGGEAGGRVVAQGTPEEVARVEGSYTGMYLRDMVGRNEGWETGEGR